MAKFDATGYLVVKISDPHKDKPIGNKCIPARWAENVLCHNYLIIRYPEEENLETGVQVKNKEPSKKTWPFHCALILFTTDSYEKAIEFITESDKQASPTAAERADHEMDLTRASASPSTSGKRLKSEETYNNASNEGTPPKKKRESAIRSGNNLKMLIQNKMLHYIPKQKGSPKKVLSLRKEARTETLEALISAGEFNKLEKLYDKTVAVGAHGSTINDEIIVTDDSDSNNEPDIIPSPIRTIPEPVPANELNPTNTIKISRRSKTPLRETIIVIDASDSINEPDITPPDRNILDPEPTNEPSPTNTTKTSRIPKIPLRETVIATAVSDSNSDPDRNILEPVHTNEVNPKNTIKTLGTSKTPLRKSIIATDASHTNNEPDKIILSYRNILDPVLTNELNPTTKTSGRSKTPLHETIIATDASDTNNEPDKIPTPDRNVLDPLLTNELNPTNTTKTAGRSKTPLRDTISFTDASDSSNEPDKIPSPDKNKLEPVPTNEPNPTNTIKTSGRSKPPLHVTIIATNSIETSYKSDKIPSPDRNILDPVLTSELNPTNTTKTSGRSKTPLRETIIATDASDTNNKPDKIILSYRNILEPVLTNAINPTNTIKTSGRSKNPLHETIIATDASDTNNKPDKIILSYRNILEPVLTNEINPTNTIKTSGRSKTPLRDTIIFTDASDSSNEPDRNILEPVPTNEPSPTNTTKNSERLKTPLRETVIATDVSDTVTIELPPPDRNRLEPVPTNEPNPTKTIHPGTSKSKLPETVDSDPTQITSSTNNLDQLEKFKSNVKGSQSSLNAEVLTLKKLIQNLAPENGTEHKIVDIKHIKDIYYSILEVKSKMNALYQEKSIELKKSFESINLFVPEIKKGLFLPTIQQLKENNRRSSNETKTVSPRQEQPQRKGPSSYSRTSSLPDSESFSDSESLSQSLNSSTSSKSCYVAKWTLKHHGSGPDLKELMPDSGIYVSDVELTRCKLRATGMRKFARLLLPLIFKNEALSKCSYTDKTRNRKRSRSMNKKPALDKHARNVLLDYVYKHAKESGWTIVSREIMNQSLGDKLRKTNKSWIYKCY